MTAAETAEIRENERTFSENAKYKNTPIAKSPRKYLLKRKLIVMKGADARKKTAGQFEVLYST